MDEDRQQPESNGAYVFDALLIRSDRSVTFAMLAIVISLMALQINPLIAGVMAIGLIAFAIVITFARPGRLWHEQVQLQPLDYGLMVIRESGRRMHADWSLFEEARLAPIGGASAALNAPAAARRWKLTLVNAFKPAIGSFLHTKAAEMTIFQFPVVLEFDAVEQEAREIHALLQACIEGAAFAPKRGIAPAATEPDELFCLAECMQCGYSLRGLPRAGRCPECGWDYDERIFLLNGEIVRGSAGTAVVIAFVLVTVCLFPYEPLAALALAALIAGVIIVQRWFEPLGMLMPGRVRVLATGRGLEQWRSGQLLSLLEWSDVSRMACAEGDHGETHLGVWRSRVDDIRFSRWSGKFRASPPFGMAMHVALRDRREAAMLVADELASRARTELIDIDGRRGVKALPSESETPERRP